MVMDMCLGKQTDLETDDWVSWIFLALFGKLKRIILRAACKLSTMKQLTESHNYPQTAQPFLMQGFRNF